MREQISEREWILLSSYLDGELNPREKSRVEEILRSRPEVGQALRSIQDTRAVLRRAPVRKVPRNFTIQASAVAPKRTWSLVPALRFSSVAAALVSVFLFASQLVPGLSLAAQPQTNEAPLAMETFRAEQPAEEPGLAADSSLEPTPPVIYWGGPPAPPADGLGGAGYPELGGYGGGEPGLESALVIPEADPAAKAGETPENQIFGEPAEEEAAGAPLEGSGPILGVASAAEQGQTKDETYLYNLPAVADVEEATAGNREAASRPAFPYTIPIAAGLVVLALALWIASIYLRRKTMP